MLGPDRHTGKNLAEETGVEAVLAFFRCQYRFLLRPPKSELRDFVPISPTRIDKNVPQMFTSIFIAVMTITVVMVMK